MNKITLFLLLITLTTMGQQIEMAKFSEFKPRSIGPAGMSGRITAIDVVNNQPNVMYVGAASGGVWKSVSEGVDWKPVFDKQPVQSIGAIAIQQNNPDVVYVGTGEGNPRNSVNGGYGIYKSLDGGETWKLMGLQKTRNIHRIIIDKDNPNTVYVAAIGSSWGEHEERGVYKSLDGGETWKKILFVDNKTGAADLVMDAQNPNKLIAAMWEHRRKPYTFHSGGPGSGLYITYDGGANWTKKTDKDGLPKGDLGRIGLAISKSNPQVVYALVEAKKNALYRSEDGGIKWTMVNDESSGRGSGGIGNRPFYYADIFVDPQNENRIYSIFTYVNYSIDGGKTFEQLMPAYNTSVGVHPDHHAFWIHPDNPKFLMDGNDGGLNISKDQGKTWRFVENLPVGQFYHINADNDFPYNLYGGMQDNGSWVGPAYVLKDQGIRNSYWQELMFGDGFDVIPDPKDNRFGYAMSQEGYVGRYDRATGLAKGIKPTHPDPDVILRFNWNSAIAMDPFDSNTIYFGSQFVHKSSNQGHEWEVISPDLTTNDPEKQKQYESGGLTMDATGAENYCTILAISPSELQRELIWAGTDDGNIQITRDGGKTWKNVTPKNIPYPKNGWVAQIKPSNFIPGEAYAIVNNYRQFDFKPYLFRTRNYGDTWENLLTNKTEEFGYTLSMVQDPEQKNLLFLGTEFGLYFSIDEGVSWTKWTENFPSVPTMDMVIHPKEHDLNIATFGRSMYVLDDIRPLRTLAKDGKSILDKTIAIFEPPTAYMAEYQQPTGMRFGANAIFSGENRKSGAMITYSINKKDKDEKNQETEEKEMKKDSLVLQIYNQNKELIRTLKEDIPEKSGLHRMYWGMREKGVQSPSREKSKSKDEPRGIEVLPGKYELVLSYAGQKDSTWITVAYDPRISISNEVLIQKYNLQKELEQKMDLCARATERLIESKEIAEAYKKSATKIDKKTYENIIKSSDSIIRQIDGFMDDLMGKEDKRQGITATEKPSNISYLYQARRYVGNLQSSPGETERILIENADKKIDPIINNINQFYQTEWPTYQKLVESTNLTPFKKYDLLK
ncbi:WD40/YVTN/BNR-like repeat-containing protein [Namhaeicola litoreus]|uniref:WD40/YVTN/BNR-like repeat-containing protein n=1 Tax=Namhaeicola litoreus TaxID=1052145 RepID=A0ABW3Y0T8_9FLAO